MVGAVEGRQVGHAVVQVRRDVVRQLPRAAHDHADQAGLEQVGVLLVVLGEVDGLVGHGHLLQEGQGRHSRVGVEGGLGVVGGQDAAALLPQQRPEVPGGVLGAGDRVGGAVDVLGRVGELLGRGAEVVPGPAVGGLGDARGLEQLLVVHQRQVVHDRREADRVAVGRRGLAGRRRELVPLHREVLDLVGDVQRAAGGLHLGGPAAEVVGDVRVGAAGEGRGELGQQLVGGRGAGRDVDGDVRVRVVELLGQALQELLGGDVLPGPHRDGDRLVRVGGLRGRGRRRGGAGGGQHQRGGGRGRGGRAKGACRSWMHGKTSKTEKSEGTRGRTVGLFKDSAHRTHKIHARFAHRRCAKKRANARSASPWQHPGARVASEGVVVETRCQRYAHPVCRPRREPGPSRQDCAHRACNFRGGVVPTSTMELTVSLIDARSISPRQPLPQPVGPGPDGPHSA